MKIIIIILIFNSIFFTDVFGTTYYVDGTKENDSGNGLSWTNAKMTLQAALDLATTNDLIYVAKGTYKPTSAYDLVNTPRNYHFRMKPGVEIYGGFAGSESTSFNLSERDLVLNETILSGDIGIEDDISDNCYHVFFHPYGLGLTNSSKLDGFTISGGNANGSYDYEIFGGGVYNDFNSPTIRNCKITTNYAEASGGGVCGIEDSSPVLINCSITNNNAEYSGGGFYYSTSSSSITAVLTNCLITDNYADYGGGIYNDFYSSPLLINCTIAGNNAVIGGGVYNNSSSSPTLNNSIIWANDAMTGSQIYISGASTTLNYSCYSNNSGDIYGTQVTSNCITTDPLFVDVTNENFRILGNSPCTDAGNNSYNTETTDIRGNGYGRKLNKTNGTAGTIDIGAYEFKYGNDPTLPSLTTTGITAITNNSALSGGNVTDEGCSAIVARGIVWSTLSSPSLEEHTGGTFTTNGSGTGTFSSTMTTLIPATTYYVRAYASNTAVTGYGSDVTFTTLSLPIVITNEISAITPYSAVSGGNVTNGGGATVTTRGVVWSTSPNPTLEFHTSGSFTTVGSGTGTFSSTITGLIPSTYYYVRAYATNIYGTAYGNNQSFQSTADNSNFKMISFQGVLRNNTGQVIQSGNYQFTFRIYYENQGGVALWSETKTINIVNGVINTDLGDVNKINLPFNTSYWLGIQVGTEPELSPRRRLTGALYQNGGFGR
jgi:hypothetical protein